MLPSWIVKLAFVLGPLIFLLSPCITLSADSYKFDRMWPILKQPWYFYQANSITIDNDGYLYIAENHFGVIRKLSSDGALITQWGGQGDKDGNMQGILSINTDRSGNIYALDKPLEYYWTCRINVFTSDGVFLKNWNIPILQYPGIAIDHDGFVYVTGDNRGILKYDTEGILVDIWGPGEFESIGNVVFEELRHIEVSPDNCVYVVNGLEGEALKFSTNGEFLTRWELRHTYRFACLSIDNDGYVFVSVPGVVDKYTANGTFVKSIESTNLRADSEIDNVGNIYSIVSGSIVNKINPEGLLEVEWRSWRFFDDGMFDDPSSIASDSNGDLYIGDSSHVQKFTANGLFLTKLGSPGFGDGQFYYTYSMDIDGSDNIYVADYNGLQKFSPDGQFLFKLDGVGGLAAIAIDSDDNFYVAINSLIQKFTSDGDFITQWDAPSTSDIAIDDSGYVYASESDPNSRVLKFTSDGQFVSSIDLTNIYNGMDFYPWFIKIGPNGCIFFMRTIRANFL